eukprot:2341744-Prymnesium_polylepis.2
MPTNRVHQEKHLCHILWLDVDRLWRLGGGHDARRDRSRCEDAHLDAARRRHDGGNVHPRECRSRLAARPLAPHPACLKNERLAGPNSHGLSGLDGPRPC